MILSRANDMDRSSSISAAKSPRRASFANAVLIGFVLGAAVPGGYGFYGLVYDVAYQAHMQQGPNQASCGMSRLLALLLIFGVAPTCGMSGAGVLAGICWWRNRQFTLPR